MGNGFYSDLAPQKEVKYTLKRTTHARKEHISEYAKTKGKHHSDKTVVGHCSFRSVHSGQHSSNYRCHLPRVDQFFLHRAAHVAYVVGLEMDRDRNRAALQKFA